LILRLARLPGLNEFPACLGQPFETDATIPLVVVGDGVADADRPFAVPATFDGRAGGVAPIASGIRLNEKREFEPAGVLAGALALAEAFRICVAATPATAGAISVCRSGGRSFAGTMGRQSA
jgi:hypothetical protein